MKNPSLEGLKWGELLEMRDRNEGTLRFRNVTNQIMSNWVDENSEALEHDDISYEYNFLSKSLNIRCMALPTHESLHIYFHREVLISLVERFGRRQAGRMAIVGGSGTSMRHFPSVFNSI